MDGVWVASNLRANAGLAEIAGLLPGHRHLAFDEQAFETYDDRERLAVLAQQVSLAESYYWIFSKTLAYLAILAYYAVLVVVIELAGNGKAFPDWPLVPEILLVALVVGGVLHGRRKMYRADRFAADRTSVEAVVAALESLDARNDESDRERARAWLLSAFWTRPSARKRIERLRSGR